MLLQVIESKTKGRCYYTKKRAKKKEILLRAEPFGIIVDQGSLERVCACCVREPKSLDDKLSFHCFHCSRVFYCSEECKSSDWKQYHSYECGFSIPVNFTDYRKDYLNLLIRVLIKWKSNSEHKDLEHIRTLCHNIPSIRNEQGLEFYESAKILYSFAKDRLQFSLPSVDHQISNLIQSRFPMEAYLEPYFLLITQEESNSFGLYTFNYLGHQQPRQGFGLALYPTAVYFNHSCAPNVGHTFTNDKCMEFFATRDLEAEECMISYVQGNTKRNDRRRILKDLFYFDCLCELCTTDETTQPFGGCRKEECHGHLIPKDDFWNCAGCGVQMK